MVAMWHCTVLSKYTSLKDIFKKSSIHKLTRYSVKSGSNSSIIGFYFSTCFKYLFQKLLSAISVLHHDAFTLRNVVIVFLMLLSQYVLSDSISYYLFFPSITWTYHITLILVNQTMRKPDGEHILSCHMRNMFLKLVYKTLYYHKCCCIQMCCLRHLLNLL